MAKLSYPNAADYLKKSNSGVYVEEIDSSIINVTPFYNQTNIVLGCSRKGVLNMPLLINSPDQFVSLFGDIDLNLERKGSYFHRTVLEMLQHSPVICMNLRLSADEDKYRWASFSTSPQAANSSPKTNNIQDFYDTSSGFWARSTESVINLAKDKYTQNLPLHFVNMSDKPVSLLIYKSDIKGYDVSVEQYFSDPNIQAEQPAFVHPKERVSDYLVDVLAVEGRWNNYKELSAHPKWGQYFNRFGIKTDMVDSFVNQSEVAVVKRWTASLLPNFLDQYSKNITISTLINGDINETGILCAYDIDHLETDYRSGALDLVGEGITDAGRSSINYLSYKRNITDLFFLEEKYLDQPGNSFGNSAMDYTETKTVYNGNGYFSNIRLKPSILSTTFNDESISVTPVIHARDSYYILQGKKVQLPADVSDSIPIKNALRPGNQLAYVVYATSLGVQFKTGSMTLLTSAVQLPFIASDALVMGYYVIGQLDNGTLTESLYPVCVGTDGFISPFRNTAKTVLVADGANLKESVTGAVSGAVLASFRKLLVEVVQRPGSINPITDTMVQELHNYVQTLFPNQIRVEVLQGTQAGTGSVVSFVEDKPSVYFKQPLQGWQQVLYFDNAYGEDLPTYHTQRMVNLWNWLSSVVVEKETILVDMLGNKLSTDWIQQDRDQKGRFLVFAPKDAAYSATILQKDFAVYVQDIELISKIHNPTDIGKQVGEQSALFDSYMDGRLNNGDSLFYSLADETNVHFTKRQGQSIIVLNIPTYTPYVGKIIVQGSLQNNELFTVSNSIREGATVVLFVLEQTIEEESPAVTFYDANEVARMNISFVDGKLHAAVSELSNVQASDIYNKEFNNDKETHDWKRTVDIEDVEEPTRLLINYDRYAPFLNEGDYLKALPIPLSDSPAENVRNWTRITEVYRSPHNPSQLVVVTDSPVLLSTGYAGAWQTEAYVPVWRWVSSLNFMVLDGYKVSDASLPDGSERQLQRILSLVSQPTRMAQALTTERIEWRYLVDSFGLGLYAGSKHELAELAERRNGVAFLNFPSVKYLRRSKTPSFSTKGRLDTQLLLQGGDRKTAGGERFTLTPTGRSHAAYFAPYVRVMNGLAESFVPPAAYAAGVYMSRKINLPGKSKWDIVAGNRNGRVSGIGGVEEIFDDEQLSDLASFGVNAITTYKEFFYYINEELTADINGGALAQVHSREVLIEVETALRDALRSFHWLTVGKEEMLMQLARVADDICKGFKETGALYDFQNRVILDDQLLDNGIGVLETNIEIVQGFRVLVLRMNILGTGNLGK